MNKRRKSVIMVILAGVLWGLINIFVRGLSDAGLEPLQISAIRVMVSALAMLALLVFGRREALKVRVRDLWMFAATGIFSLVLFNVCYFYTVVHSQTSIAVVLLYTSPVFVMILSALIYKEKITPIKIAALLLTVGGCVLTAGFIGGEYSVTPVIMLTGLGSGLFYAFYTIISRRALKTYSSLTVTTYTFIFAVLGAAPLGDVPGIVSKFAEKPLLILYALGIGVICTVLPYCFYTAGLEGLESGRAAILVAVEPLVGAVIGMTFFRESHDLPKLIGIAMILGAIVLMNLGIPDDPKTQNDADDR